MCTLAPSAFPVMIYADLYFEPGANAIDVKGGRSGSVSKRLRGMGVPQNTS